MRNIILSLLLCSLLLLSACGSESESPADSSQPEGSAEDQSATEESENGEESAASAPLTLDSPGEDLPIDITYVTPGETVDWQDWEATHNGCTLSLPEGWTVVDGEAYGLWNGAYFVPPNTDLEEFQWGPHFAIELPDFPLYAGEDGMDYTSESAQKEIFAYLIVTSYSKMGGLSDLEFSVWQREDETVLIVDYIRSNDVITMYQTTYYVLGGPQDYVVYATNFGEDTQPPVQEAARHLISTFQPA